MRQMVVAAGDRAKNVAFAPDEQDALALDEADVGSIGLDHQVMHLAEPVLGAGAGGRARSLGP